MHVFVTGATGFVGSAVIAELIAAGHQVTGLARSETGAAALSKAGARVQRGTLEDLPGLGEAAAAADGVIHTGFNHDFTKFAANCELDRRAIAALGAALKGSDRPLLVTSGIAHLAQGRAATEADMPPAPSATYPRASEAAAAALRREGVKAATLRLPPSVHGAGDHGFVPMLIILARKTGASAYIGDGENRWAAVHRRDAARAYRLALEQGATEPAYHAVAEEGIPFKEIATAIGRGLDLPVVAKSPQEAADHFGWFAAFAGIEMAGFSARTQKLLGWTPTGPGLLSDIAAAGYFGG